MILVVERRRVVTKLLQEALQEQGLRIVTVPDGEEATCFALSETPHLIILNTMLSGRGGYRVVRQLRNHPKSMHIPIMVLSATGNPASKVRAFEEGADDYITKPYHADELVARVRRQLRRASQNLLSPLTGLPGGVQVARAIDEQSSQPEPWSIVYLDLNNFKAFNDAYGFLAGNEMILLVSRICQRIVQEYGNRDDFVGHIGGDDFVIITTPDRAQDLCRRISTPYEQESLRLYHTEDRERGSIRGEGRDGRASQFPLVSLALGVVHCQRPQGRREVGSLTAEAKRLAKRSESHIFHIPSHPS